MITIITGPQGSGKTTKAKELVKEMNASWVSEEMIQDPFWTGQHVAKDTSVIVIDELTNLAIIEEFEKYGNSLMIEERGCLPKFIKMPELIFVYQGIILEIVTTGDHEIKHIPLTKNYSKDPLPEECVRDITVKGELLFELANKNQWINRVPQILPENQRGESWVWVDKNGNVFECGADFSAAEKAETYPCKVYRLQSVAAAHG